MTSREGIRAERTLYDSSAAEAGIVHLGYGMFHRAHQAVYFDDYMEATGDLGWGIAAVNLRSEDSSAFAEARSANGGYLLKTTSPDGERQLRLVRSHVEFADWAGNGAAAEALLARRKVRAITITVTESGYYLDDAGSLNVDSEVIRDEIAGRGGPRSVYSFLANSLKLRANALNEPISILCCDNIRANGTMIRSNFLVFLEVTGQAELARWVEDNVAFPCSMVDRITPRVTEALVKETRENFPGSELRPIHSEAFRQWVLEDKFAAPMADLSKVGVEVVKEVNPFEEAKIRILNGGHTGLAYLGALSGYATFDQTMSDPRLRRHFDAWERDEVLPGLTMELPFDKLEYLGQVADRFCNAAIADQLERICMDGWSKMPIFIKPTLTSCLRQGLTPRRGFKSVAGWYVFARRFSKGLMGFQYRESCWHSLSRLLDRGQEEAFARAAPLWAGLPTEFPEFVPGIVSAIDEVENEWPV